MGSAGARTTSSNDRPSTSCNTPLVPGSGTDVADGTVLASNAAAAAWSGENRMTVCGVGWSALPTSPTPNPSDPNVSPTLPARPDLSAAFSTSTLRSLGAGPL